jgi:hypothetical protein
MLNQKHPVLNLLLAHGMIVGGVDTDGCIITIDMGYPQGDVARDPAPEAAGPPELLKNTEVTHSTDEKENHIADEKVTLDQSQTEPAVAVVAEEHQDERQAADGSFLNTSAQSLAVRRGELRKIINVIAESKKGRIEGLFFAYECNNGKYGRNRFAVWMWIFENNGWIAFTDRWTVKRHPTDEELEQAVKIYLEKKGNWDHPGPARHRGRLERGRHNSSVSNRRCHQRRSCLEPFHSWRLFDRNRCQYPA